MKNKLAEIMKAKGLTQQDVADALGVSRPTISYWQRSDNLSARTVSALAEFLNVSISELFGAQEQEDGSQVIKVESEGPLKPGFVRVPVYDVYGSCGNGAENSTELVKGSIDLAAWFVHGLSGVTSINHLQIVNSTGDSMEPTIESRALVLVDTNQTTLRGDGIYCLRVGDSIFIKRVLRELDGSLTLLSDNTVYPPRTVSRDQLESLSIIGRVVYSFNGKVI